MKSEMEYANEVKDATRRPQKNDTIYYHRVVNSDGRVTFQQRENIIESAIANLSGCIFHCCNSYVDP